MKININSHVIIYPSDEGWVELAKLHQKAYKTTYNDAVFRIDSYRAGGGFKCPLWVLMEIYNGLFFDGSQYLDDTHMDLCDNVIITKQEIRNLKIDQII
jgi:hypothetical protein